jgi:hypothetical protein
MNKPTMIKIIVTIFFVCLIGGSLFLFSANQQTYDSVKAKLLAEGFDIRTVSPDMFTITERLSYDAFVVKAHSWNVTTIDTDGKIFAVGRLLCEDPNVYVGYYLGV